MEEKRREALNPVQNPAPLGPEGMVNDAELYALLELELNRIHMGQSSSYRIEQAEEVLRSIGFLLSLAQGAGAQASLPPEERLRQGRAEGQRLLQRARILYDRVRRTLPPVKSRALLGTVGEIEGFFKRYDLYRYAHDIPCMIDYQLLWPMPELSGVLYITQYLKRLLYEHALLSRFEGRVVKALLLAYAKDYEALLLNLCEPVLHNALGLVLLQQSPWPLCISEPARGELRGLFFSQSEGEIETLLTDAAKELLRLLGAANPALSQYFCTAAQALAPRLFALKNSEGLDRVFLSF